MGCHFLLQRIFPTQRSNLCLLPLSQISRQILYCYRSVKSLTVSTVTMILFFLTDFSVQLSHSVVSDFCDPMEGSTPGFPVQHQLPEFTQTHVHWVGDAIQPSHPLLSPPPPTFNLSQQQGLFQWVSLCIRWPKYWSFSLGISPSNSIQDWFPLGWSGWIALQSKGLSRVFFNTTVQKHQFFSAQLSL